MPEPGTPAVLVLHGTGCATSPGNPSSIVSRGTYGYELLSRCGPENLFRCTDPNAATIRRLISPC